MKKALLTNAKLHIDSVGMLTLLPAKAALESIFIDIIGERTRNTCGHRYLLVITESFTKLVKTVKMNGISSGKVAKQSLDHWVLKYGPVDLIADNEKQLTSCLFLDVCQILNIHNAFTEAYHSQKWPG